MVQMTMRKIKVIYRVVALNNPGHHPIRPLGVTGNEYVPDKSNFVSAPSILDIHLSP